ncbi:NAD-P-binding protein [Cristinia sonorae]|uniref:NAD-P-binding protein n=1 Tax=Cristinia sonorae TaxID=1940300 RepID=A0A8K0UTS8_9AGAR|nr:NAD-P-binding protein [Cristinia sonorae]
MTKANISSAKCILVIGATSGIGKSLAIALHDLPSKPKVIVAGRRQERLDEISAAHAGIDSIKFDTTAGREVLQKFVADITAKYPDLDGVVFSAGVQHVFDFLKPESFDLDLFETELTTNYTSIVTLIVSLLPHFLKLSAEGRPSFIIPITSGLGIVPIPRVVNYAATKSALHNFTLSLNSQLSETNVHVMEIFPPLVESELHDHQGLTPILSKVWMPLTEFTDKAIAGLLRGDVQIGIGNSGKDWERYEKGKVEQIAEQEVRFKAFKQQFDAQESKI